MYVWLLYNFDKYMRFEHNNPWQWIKVGIGMGYCNSTCFQTRGPTVQKWMFLLYVPVEFIFHLILISH